MLKNLLKEYKINLNKSQIKKFEKFLKLFQEKNNEINLSSIKNENDIIEKHFIDSLILTKFIKLKGNIADLGTGGGFPGIPLAIYFENSSFSLVDSVGKKIKQVNYFTEKLDLKNIKTINSRFEDFGQNKDYREKFDFVVSRATAYLPSLIEYAIPLLKNNGIFIAYKNNNENEIKESSKSLKELNSEIIDIKKYSLSKQERIFIIIKKLGKTKDRYPRRIGVPNKKPIL